MTPTKKILDLFGNERECYMKDFVKVLSGFLLNDVKEENRTLRTDPTLETILFPHMSFRQET
jgi:hypothetical protein